MIEYIYIVKCPNCEDEHFHFFDEAKACAMGYMSDKPIITQVEVERNDFGECTDSHDLGTVWSWEDVMKDIPAEPEATVFSKSETFGCTCKNGGECTCDGDCKCHKDSEFDEDDFFTFEAEDFPLDEGINKDEQVELMKLARELGINTPKELEEFIEVTDIPGASPLEKLRNYRASLGADFDISKKDKPRFRTTLAGKELVFKNDAEYEEVKKMCQELELDLKNLDTFIEDREINDLGTFVDELRAYHREVFESLEITRKPVPEGMTIEQLVEEMEENEDTVECALCQDLFDKSTCRKELNLGWLCSRCADDLAARGEGPVFKEDNYWDFLDEEVEEPEAVHDLGNTYDGGYPEGGSTLCPECGKETFDVETGICVTCGFN